MAQQWKVANESILAKAQETRGRAQAERNQAVELIRNNSADLQRTQREVQNKLALRIDDIELRKSDLTQSIENTENEIAELNASKDLVERTISEKDQPLVVSVECQHAREGRVAPDLVADDVDSKLAQEVRLLLQVQDIFREKYAEIVEQLRLLRASAFQMREDLKDKAVSHSIDSDCAQLDATRSDIGLFRDTVRASTADRAKLPEEWDRFTQSNIVKSVEEVKKSVALRDKVDALSKSTADQVLAAANNVELAFNTRLAEYNDARNAAAQQLAKIQQEINLQDRCVQDLKEVLASREAPLRLATTRLEKRQQRPNIEFVKDPAQFALVKEVGDLDLSIDQLKDRLENAEDALKALLRSKLALEENIACKVNSINIDNACMLRRQELKYAAL